MEGEKRDAAAGGENGCGGIAIDGGENLAGVVQLSATGLGFQIGKHRSEEEMMANLVGHITRAEDIPHGVAMAGGGKGLAGVHGSGATVHGSMNREHREREGSERVLTAGKNGAETARRRLSARRGG
jgi:hypothetical protein